MLKFVARTRKTSNSLIITLPNELELKDKTVYQFSVEKLKKKEGDRNE